MAAKPTKRPDLRTQRKLSARSKTAKPAQGLPTPESSDEDDSVQSLQLVRQHKIWPVAAEVSQAGKMSGDATLLLYAPAGQWLIDDVQMFADFYEKHYPPSLQVWRQITYLRSLLDFTPRTPVLERARRTIGLTHLAAATGDARLIRESRVSYGRLLGMLQFSLTFPSKIKTASETRELAASIALLTHVSDLPNPNKSSDDSWCAHMWAAQQLFTMYAPIFLPGEDHLDQGIMRHTAMNGFFLAVAKRRAWNVDTAWFHGLKSKGWTTLIPAFNRLPTLLEETDKALSRRSEVSTLLKIVTELSQIRGQTAEIYPELNRPATMDPAAMQDLDASSEEHLVMADSETFPELYVPLIRNGAIDAMKIVLTATLSLVLECTILRIWHFRPETLCLLPDTAQRDMEDSAYNGACRLCKVSLSYTQSEKIAYVSVLRYCLSLARNVFEQQDKHPEMGWCDACLIANRLRMERIRQICAPTLCKVEDVTAGIAEAGRYKSRFDPRAFVVRAAQVPSMRLLQ